MEYGQQMQQAKENAKLSFYQNPGYQVERREKKSFILKVLGGQVSSAPFEFKVSLHEPLIIDRLSDIFLENFTTYHTSTVTSEDPNKSAFILKINEFNHQGNSTDPTTFNSLIIPNEYTDGNMTGRKIHKGKKLNYVASINPSTLRSISGSITDLGGGAMFVSDNDIFLAEFIIVARD